MTSQEARKVFDQAAAAAPDADAGAIIRHNQKHGYISVLCPIGHLIEARKLDRSFGGSAFEAELAFRRPGDRFDRLAAQCDGAGHELRCEAIAASVTRRAA